MHHRSSQTMGSWLMALVAFAGCGGPASDLSWYQPAVKSGFRQIPESLQIEQLCGEADHFISYYPKDGTRQSWTSDVFFEGRYHLSMEVNVQLADDYRSITEVADEMQFFLWEVDHVHFNTGLPGARIAKQWKFGKDDWQKVVRAKGDFSVIGINLKRGQPLPNFDAYVKSARKDRIQVRPD